MDTIQKILQFTTDYLSDYLNSLFLTLSKTSILFPPVEKQEADKETILLSHKVKIKKYQINPKLLQFAAVSIFLGLTFYTITPTSTTEPDLILSTIFNMSIWILYSGLIQLTVKIFGGKGSFLETISISIQVFSAIYVVCNLLALIDGIIVTAWFSKASKSNLIIQILLEPPLISTIFKTVLLVVFLPIIIKASHEMHTISLALSTIVILTCLSSITVTTLNLFYRGYLQEIGLVGLSGQDITPTPTPTSQDSIDYTQTPLPPLSGQIIFVSDRDGEKNLYITSPNGSTQTRFTEFEAEDPHISPDETRIAFVSNASGNMDIYILEIATRNIVRITDAPEKDASPSWSPDGTKIVFESFRDNNFEIYMVEADGSNTTRLTNDPASDVSPVWSPVSNEIAFVSNRFGDANIFLLTPNGDIATLTTSIAPDIAPAWSPDGSKIAFQTFSGEFSNICMIGRDGLGHECLTSSPSTYGPPVWSPDGNFLAINAKQNTGYGFNIFKVLDGTSIQLSAPGIDPSGDPAWSPEGIRLVFQAQANGNIDLFFVLIPTNEFMRITSSNSYDGEPIWIQK